MLCFAVHYCDVLQRGLNEFISFRCKRTMQHGLNELAGGALSSGLLFLFLRLHAV